LKWTDVLEVRTAFIALMLEAVHISETSGHFKMATRRYIPEDSKLHTHRRENLKSHSQYSDYGLDDRAIEVRSPAEAKRIFFL
jgi:hypothetical protein